MPRNKEEESVEIMDSIEVMMGEHRLIERMLKVMRKACYGIMQGEEVNYADFELMIDFVKTYSDAHHHGKEEKLLFNEMVTYLGPLGSKLVKNGMLVEHDLGRLHIQELVAALERVKAGDEESKLDVIANAISYTHLLTRHIEKEDKVVYTFAKRELPAEVLEKVNAETEAFEEEAEAKCIQKHYHELLEGLEKKYNIQ